MLENFIITSLSLFFFLLQALIFLVQYDSFGIVVHDLSWLQRGSKVSYP
jgi:hypothetical protein